VQIVKELSVYPIGWRGYFGPDNWLQRRLSAIVGSTSSQPKIRTIGSSPSGRRQKLSLLVLIVGIVGIAALEVSLKARTGGFTNAASVNIEARGRTASVPPDNHEPRQPTTNARNFSAATDMATLSLPPLPRDRPMNNRSKRKGPPHQLTMPKRSLPRGNDEIGQLIAKTVKSSAITRSLPRDGLTP
jgi:hypothetical protein